MKRLNIQSLYLLVSVLILIAGTAWKPAIILSDSGVTRISFARGATSATVIGHLAANSTKRYVLGATARQLMDVSLSAPEGVSLKATRNNGRSLTPVNGTSGSTGFRGYLPYTGDFFLTVTSGNQAVDFNLNVFIPMRISFKRGATSARLEGHLDANQSMDYILRASGGQIMEVNATPASAGVPLQQMIYGVDGSVLRSGMGEGSNFRGQLPSSQDYLVRIRAGEKATDFTLDVIIPQRIQFKSGANSGSLRTRLPADLTQYYVLSAMKDQRMRVEITPEDNLQLIIYGMDGNVLKSGMGEEASFDGQLLNTQDYILAVRNVGRLVSYTLRVTIR